MKTRIPAAALALLIIICMAFMPGAAASDIYAGSGALGMPLAEAWVRTSSGASPLGADEAYVRTGSGLVRLGSGEAAEPGAPPEHLEVSGALELEYDKMRVALYYYEGESSIRKPTLDYANLENEVGSGYYLGYYDSGRDFVALASTDETRITMVMDRTTSTPGGAVGCWHVLLPGAYESYEEAMAAASAYPGGFAGWYEGEFRALYGAYSGSGEAASALAAYGGESVYTASEYCVTVTRTEDARILFEFDGGEELGLGVLPAGEDTRTWFKGNTYRGGFEYIRRTGERLTVINVVDIEDYVKGVLPYEMSEGWPAEALKAQAVCARTYAAAHFDGLPGYRADVTNDTFSQAYLGDTASGPGTDAAVEATEGLYLVYGGEPIDAMYCSSNGGATEDSENVMLSAVPYLRGKADPYEAAAAEVNPNSSWTRSFSASEIQSRLASAGWRLGSVASVETALSESGNVIGLTFASPEGYEVTLEKSVCYNFVTGTLGLSSIRFEVEAVSGGFAFTGSGWGHSLGMSQYGAYAMALSYGFDFDQILNFYFTDVELVRGE